mmetsp:Transcript_132172/g.333929  ORF Transcript_132172/g.333929 Transcript_132172/m.333929 type:complete len:206 (+) Transcript_132172:132-749(+)
MAGAYKPKMPRPSTSGFCQSSLCVGGIGRDLPSSSPQPLARSLSTSVQLQVLPRHASTCGCSFVTSLSPSAEGQTCAERTLWQMTRWKLAGGNLKGLSTRARGIGVQEQSGSDIWISRRPTAKSSHWRTSFAERSLCRWRVCSVCAHVSDRSCSGTPFPFHSSPLSTTPAFRLWASRLLQPQWQCLLKQRLRPLHRQQLRSPRRW